MQKIINYFRQYIGVISIVLAVCILLTYTLSYFMVNTGNKRAAEMYVGELKYSITIEGNNTNTLSVPAGETIVDMNITNKNGVDTYFKLLYLKNSNVTISYYDETKDTSEVYTKYLSSGDLLEKGLTGTLKLKIINNSSSTQMLTFSVSGGYSTNKLSDVEVPSTYSEITTMETIDSNTYFCKTSDTLSQGLEYVDGQYTYRYMQQGAPNNDGISWEYISKKGWGVQLTDKTSTDTINSKLCTYINNKPTISMTYMFSNSSAAQIDVSNFDTSYVIDMNYMFANSNATIITGLNVFDTNKVTDMSHMFSRSQSEKIDVSGFDTSNVTKMRSMFYNTQATSLDVSNFDTSKVTDMAYMFYNSKAISLDLSSFDTSKVTNMNSMFYGVKVSELDLSSFNTSKVTNMSMMFINSAATSIVLSSFDTSNVTDMGFMFQETKVNTLNLSSFDTSKVTTMQNMFYNSSATSINISNFNTSNVTNMSNMFGSSKITSLDLSNFDTSKVTNMSVMFENLQTTEINGLNKFDTSNVTNMSRMFRNSKVKIIDLSNFDTSNVTNMNSMFNSTTNLETIYVSDKFTTSNVTSSDDMFTGCTSLVGGNGTKYNSSYVDKTYARIDTASTPGYFTKAAEKPGVPSSFATDSWATIINAVKNNNISNYNIGDTKEIDMGSYGTHTLRIANTTTPSECSTSGFSQSACGFVIEFVDIITTHNINSTQTNVGGWPSSSMYTFVNTDIYNTLPDDLKTGIINTTVVSGHGSTSGEGNFTSTDKLYLLSPKEIYKDWSLTYDTAKDVTRTLDYYTKVGVTTSSYSGAIKNNGTTAAWWFLRTARSNNTLSFYAVSTDGSYYSISTANANGVSPAFRIG